MASIPVCREFQEIVSLYQEAQDAILHFHPIGNDAIETRDEHIDRIIATCARHIMIYYQHSSDCSIRLLARTLFPTNDRQQQVFFHKTSYAFFECEMTSSCTEARFLKKFLGLDPNKSLNV